MNTPVEFQMWFHREQMQKIKRECKDVCYISHSKEKLKSAEGFKDAYFILVNVKNELGGKDVVRFPLSTTPDQMTANEYDFVLNTIKNKEYGGSTETLQ